MIRAWGVSVCQVQRTTTLRCAIVLSSDVQSKVYHSIGDLGVGSDIFILSLF